MLFPFVSSSGERQRTLALSVSAVHTMQELAHAAQAFATVREEPPEE
jgi:hypothetical protein